MVEDRQKDCEVENTGERLTCRSESPLVIHVRAVYVTIEQSPCDIAGQRDQHANSDDRQYESNKLVGGEVIRKSRPG